MWFTTVILCLLVAIDCSSRALRWGWLRFFSLWWYLVCFGAHSVCSYAWLGSNKLMLVRLRKMSHGEMVLLGGGGGGGVESILVTSGCAAARPQYLGSCVRWVNVEEDWFIKRGRWEKHGNQNLGVHPFIHFLCWSRKPPAASVHGGLPAKQNSTHDASRCDGDEEF